MDICANEPFELRREAADSAIVGAFVCMVPFFVITTLFLAYDFAQSGSLENFSSWEFADKAINISLLLSAYIICHWLPAAFFGRGNVKNIRFPNILVMAMMFLFIFSAFINLNFVCGYFKISNITPPAHFGFDSPEALSPCGTLLRQIDEFLSEYLPVCLLLISTVSRVTISRMKVKAS